MGYNTTVIVLNDALHEIENDPLFGRKLGEAIARLSLGNKVVGDHGVDISAGSHVNAATAIESHHADYNAIVAVGGNCATVIGMTYGHHHRDEDKEVILRQLANELGFSLRRKPKATR